MAHDLGPAGYPDTKHVGHKLVSYNTRFKLPGR